MTNQNVIWHMNLLSKSKPQTKSSLQSVYIFWGEVLFWGLLIGRLWEAAKESSGFENPDVGASLSGNYVCMYVMIRQLDLSVDLWYMYCLWSES